MPNWLRWVAVLPAALLAAVLSVFPLHFVLYQTLTGSGIVEPYPETPERMLTPFVSAAAFIWAGARIAPKHRVGVAAVLLALWLLVLGGAIALVFSSADPGDLEFELEGGGLATIMSVVGAIAGLYVVLKQNTIGATAEIQ